MSDSVGGTSCRRPLLESLEPRLLLDAAGEGQALELFSTAPAVFAENRGQWAAPAIRYAFDGAGANVGFTAEGPVFQIFRREPVEDDGSDASDTSASADEPSPALPPPLPPDPLAENQEYVTRGTSFSVHFDGASPTEPVGLNPAETRFNYFVGGQANWRTDVPTYETVAYEGLYDGIDLYTWGQRESLKYEFHVAPGADYRDIRVSYEGIDGLSLDADGALHVETELGDLVDAAPVIYQEAGGERTEVAGQFRLVDEDTYTFEITGAYDATRELVLDPDLAWSTYLGGSAEDEGRAIAVDSSDNALVTGYTYSSGWPSGGWDTSFGGSEDVCVAKLSPSGGHLWSTYLGGSYEDRGQDIAVDASGSAYVTGRTYSPGWATPGAYDTIYNGSWDVFVAKLSASGSSLFYATYLGGSDNDSSRGIAVDASGSAYVTGYTESSGWATPGAYDTTHNWNRDVFVAKLSASGSSLLYATYLGGSEYDGDYGEGIAVDASGNAYVTGETSSSGWATPGAYDTTHNGGMEYDVFVAKLSASGSSLLYATYLGGSNYDYGRGIAVDPSGSAYVTGGTQSPGWVTPEAYDTRYDGPRDAFVAKLSASGSSLLYATYLGGSNYDYGRGIAVDPSGRAYVTGGTQSPGWTSGGWDTSLGGIQDAFVVKLSPLGGHLWSSYLGGSDSDWGHGIAMDGAGNALVTGRTDSAGWTSGGWDTSYGGDRDAFVAKVTFESALPGHEDIGGPALPGSYLFNGGVHTVEGGGSDIWGTSDEFHYAYDAVTGNGEIVAHVTSIDPTDPWAKAGVMMRASLDPDSAHAAVFVTPGNGVVFQWRLATGQGSLSVHLPGQNETGWVKLRRMGQDFAAYYSANGTSWTQCAGTVTIPMAGTVQAGLAVTSHDPSQLCTGVFDNVEIRPPLDDPPDGIVSLVTESQRDFSDVQGERNWYYGYYDGDGPSPYSSEDFELLPRFGPDRPGSGWDEWYLDNIYWTHVARNIQHPDEGQWPVRRWVSPSNADLKVRVHFDAADSCGNGTVGHLIVDGEEIWAPYIGPSDTAGVTGLFDLQVNAGSIIDIAVSPNGGIACDSTTTECTIWQAGPGVSLAMAEDTGTSATDGITNDATPTFTWSASDPSHVASYQYSVDGGAWTDTTATSAEVPLAEGDHTFAVRAIDVFGKTGPEASVDVTVDLTPPDAPVGLSVSDDRGALPDDGLTNDAELLFSWTQPSSPAGVWGGMTEEYFNRFGDDSLLDPIDSGYGLLTQAPVGQRPLTGPLDFSESELVERASGVIGWDDFAVLWSGQMVITEPGTYTFGTMSDDGSVCWIDLDGDGRWEKDVGELVVDNRGEHAPQVRRGEVGLAAETYDVIYAMYERAGGAEMEARWGRGSGLAWNALETVETAYGQEYRVDGGDWVGVAGLSVSVLLAEGSHTFEVRSVDVAGNVSAEATTTVEVDLTPPSATPGLGFTEDTGVSPADGVTSDASPVFSWNEATDAHGIWQYEYRLDEGEWSEMTGTSVEVPLAEGSHTFGVRAVDNAGNHGEEVTQELVVDVTGPASTLTVEEDTGISDADGITADAAPTFEWFSTDPNGMWYHQYRLDGGAWTETDETTFSASLSEGEHTFEVRGVDAAGNPGAVASKEVIVDLSAPAPPPSLTFANDTGISNEDALTKDSDPLFTWQEPSDLSGIAVYQYRVDGDEWTEVAGRSVRVSVMGGEHTFEVRAIDRAGNVGGVATSTFEVDLRPPSAIENLAFATDTGSSDTDGLTNDRELSLTWSPSSDLSGIWKYQYRVDDGGWVSVDQTSAMVRLGEGWHVLSIRALDKAGNPGTAATQTVRVDLCGPTLELTMSEDTGASAEDGITSDSTPTFVWLGSDPSGVWYYEYSLDGADWTQTSGTSLKLALAEGEHAFSVRAVDHAGNAGAIRTMAVEIDRASPSLVSHAPDGVAFVPVDHVDLTFSELIDPATLTADTLTLTGPSGAVAEPGFEISPTGEGTWRVDFAPQHEDGGFTLTLPAAVTDVAGNPMAGPQEVSFEQALANLDVSAEAAADTVSPGERLSLDWTVENTGAGDAEAQWRDDVYLSADATWDPDDGLLASQSGGPLPAGGTYECSLQVELPAQGLASGVNYLLVRTDASEDQPEINESNNTAVLPVTVLYPDLQASIAGPAEPVTAKTAQDLPLSLAVSNVGAGHALAPWQDAVYWSEDASWDESDSVLWQETSSGHLPVTSGDGYEVQPTVTVPAAESAGTYYLLWRCNVDAGVLEIDDGNNIASLEIEVVQTSELGIASPLFSPAKPVVGETVRTEAEVTNHGPAEAPATEVAFYLGDPETGDLIGTTDVPPLTEGEHYVAGVDWDTAGISPGDVTVWAVVDPSGAIDEADETDNTGSANVVVGQPHLHATWSAPEEFEAGRRVDLELRVSNQGTRPATDVRLDLDLALPAGVELVSVEPEATPPGSGEWVWPALAAGQAHEVAITLDLDHRVTGAFSLRARVTYTDRAVFAYNPVETTLPATVSPDHTRPAVLVELSETHTAAGEITVRVEANEPLDEVPVLTARDAGGALLGVTYQGEESGAYTYTVNGAGAAEGTARLKATARDLSGNTGTATASFVVDRTPPEFLLPAADGLFGVGEHTIAVRPTEALEGPPEVNVTDSAGRPVPVSAGSRAGAEWRYRLTIDPTTAAGAAALRVTGRDVTGNEGSRDATIYVDTAAPTFGLTAPDLVGLGTFEVELVPDETLAVLPTLEVTDADGAPVEVLGPRSEDGQYTFTVRTQPDTAGGEATLTARAADAAGNTREQSVTTRIDPAAPALGVTVTPDPPHEAGAVTVRATADEPLAGPPELVASLDGQTSLPVGEPTQDGNAYEWVFDADDVAVVTVTASDPAGNQAEETLTFGDVSVTSSDVSLSAIPNTGSDVAIEAVVRNPGPVRITSVPVSFQYIAGEGVEPLGPDQFVTLDAGESTVLSAVWPAAEQEASWSLSVVVDPDEILPETDEQNNVAVRGPVVMSHAVARSTCLVSETELVHWARPFDSSTMRPLPGGEASVRVWVEDGEGQTVLGPYWSNYNATGERFETTLNPSGLPGPGRYDVVSEATAGNFAPARERLTLLVIRDFSVGLAPENPVYERGDLIMLSGQVTDDDGEPLAHAGVSLTMTAQYGTRRFSVTADEAGHYQLPYEPAETEAGQYEVTASVTQGDITRSSPAATFEIRGLYLQAARTSTRLNAGDQQTVRYRIVNLGTSPLTGLAVTLHEEGGEGEVGATLDLSETAATLAGGEMTTFGLDLLAEQMLGEHGYEIEVRSDEGSLERSALAVEVTGTEPAPRFDPVSLEVTVPNGGRVTRTVTLRNGGWHAAEDLALTTDLPDWVSMMGGDRILGHLPGHKGLEDEGFGLFDKYSLLCQVGPDGEVRQVGSDASFPADRTGELFFRINEADGALEDNSGRMPVRLGLQGDTVPTTVDVSAQEGWQGTGLTVVTGQHIRVEADGIWDTAPEAPRDADGNGAVRFSLMWSPEDEGLVTGEPFDGEVGLVGSNISDLRLPIRSWVSAADTGGLDFTVTDPAGGAIEGAQVTLYGQQYDPATQAFPVFRASVDHEGHVNFHEVTPGPYGWRVTAEEYEEDRGTTTVEQGQVTEIAAQLDPDLVTVEWVVEETEIDDRYNITLRTTYRVEEGEPAPPVLVAAPIQHSLVPEQTIQSTLRIRNAGERPATNVFLTLPHLTGGEGGGCEIRFVLTDPTAEGPDQTTLTPTAPIGSILPGETVELPYRVMLGSEVQVGQVFRGGAAVHYEYEDASGRHREQTTIPVQIGIPADKLLFNPATIWKFMTHEIGVGAPGVQSLDFGQVRVTNASSHNSVDRLSGPVGGLVKMGVGLADLVGLAASAGTSAIAKAALAIIKVYENVAVSEKGVVIGGSVIWPEGEDHVLDPGEYCYMHLGGKHLTLGPEFDLLKVGFGQGYLGAHWVDPEHDTWSGVSIFIGSIVTGIKGLEINWTPFPMPVDFGDGDDTSGGGGNLFSGWPGVGPPPSFDEEEGPKEQYVTFDINQTATFDRQAFEGTLNITNGSETYDLENLRVEIEVTDEAGNVEVLTPDDPMAGELYFAEPELSGALSGVGGAGFLPAGTTGTAEWLIIPTEEAGGHTYDLEAHLLWDWAGVDEENESEPVSITVAPQPHVHLDYYIQPRFAAGEPFYLGVEATNTGEGPVENLRLDTEQPQIVWDETDVEDAEVRIEEGFTVDREGNRKPADSLALELGDLAPGESRLGWWNLKAWPGGEVTDFHIHRLEHDEALGGETTSLLDASAHTHWVTQFGLVRGAPGSEGGMCALMDWDRDGTPDSLYDTSDGSRYDVSVVDSEVTRPPTFDSPEMHLGVDKPEGWVLVQTPDRFAGSLQIERILAGDRLVDPANYWVEDGTLHIVDDPAAEYVVQYETQPSDQTETGTVRLDEVQYAGYGATGHITLTDADLDQTFGPGNDVATVQLTSSADPDGETITLTETAEAGVFAGDVGFEASVVPGNGKVHAADGYLVTVTYADEAGYDGTPTPVTAQGQWVAMDVPVSAALDPVSDTGLPGDGLTNDSMPTLTGETEALAEVNLEIGGPEGYILAETVQADEAGTWAFAVPPASAMPDGLYTVTATATDEVGNVSEEPATFEFRVETHPPTVDAWYSGAVHDHDVGEALLEIADDGSFSEPRLGGLKTLLLEFSEAIDPASLRPENVEVYGLAAPDNTEVDLSGITISTSTRNGDTMAVIEFSEALPDVTRYLIRVTGVTDAAGNPLAGDNDRIMTALLGDASGDLRVNNTDVGGVKSLRGTNQIDPEAWYEVRSDLTMDGRVNNTDVGGLYTVRGRDARFIPDPVAPETLMTASREPIEIACFAGLGSLAVEPEASAGSAEPRPMAEPTLTGVSPLSLGPTDREIEAATGADSNGSEPDPIALTPPLIPEVGAGLAASDGQSSPRPIQAAEPVTDASAGVYPAPVRPEGQGRDAEDTGDLDEEDLLAALPALAL